MRHRTARLRPCPERVRIAIRKSMRWRRSSSWSGVFTFRPPIKAMPLTNHQFNNLGEAERHGGSIHPRWTTLHLSLADVAGDAR